jgi:solute carrier family 6 amino acid transporter-like protein 5/7/9/14
MDIFFYDFSRRVLQISSGIENVDGVVTHLVVALAIAWLICFLALSKGVQSLGKVKSIKILLF